MTMPISPHFSFIVRCWRGADGALHGWVVDALTQRAYPFATEREMAAHIAQLSQDPEAKPVASALPHPANRKGERHESP
jgi:hypothetical protein